ncbi:hypothetical protein EWB00_010863 [Schistosoma japonicum]|uniref:Uncharacterized protein n=1 Tax=Schistosoma japonicum TaxID=6182 RepID=A0A4Z2DMS3_SCHJA|nr:hypothetical protein EWB00_010863 [Schistosoma japonicum]
MFYSVDLLSAHRGKFGIIWLAATRITDTCFSFGEDLLPNNLELISGSIADNPNDAQSVYGAPGTIRRRKKRVSEHLVLENESGAVKYPLIKLSCDSNESQIGAYSYICNLIQVLHYMQICKSARRTKSVIFVFSALSLFIQISIINYGL